MLDMFDGFRHAGDGNRARTERRDLHQAAFRRCALYDLIRFEHDREPYLLTSAS
jgi:hypothetical protein